MQSLPDTSLTRFGSFNILHNRVNEYDSPYHGVPGIPSGYSFGLEMDPQDTTIVPCVTSEAGVGHIPAKPAINVRLFTTGDVFIGPYGSAPTKAPTPEELTPFADAFFNEAQQDFATQYSRRVLDLGRAPINIPLPQTTQYAHVLTDLEKAAQKLHVATMLKTIVDTKLRVTQALNNAVNSFQQEFNRQRILP